MLRERTRWAARLATFLGAAAGLALVGLLLRDVIGRGYRLDATFLLLSATLVGLAAVLPRALVLAVGRRLRRRHRARTGRTGRAPPTCRDRRSAGHGPVERVRAACSPRAPDPAS